MNRPSHDAREGDRSDRQDGFALLVALLAIVGLTALATGGFVLSSSEHDVSDNFGRSQDAFYVAQSGLNQFLATNVGTPSGSQTYSFSSGTAEVSAFRMATTGSDGRSVYRVVSEGRVEAGRGRESTRVVSTLAVLDPLFTSLPGALVSGTGVQKNGSSGEISGIDDSDSNDCPSGGQNTAGLFVPPDDTPDDEGNGYGDVDEQVTEGDPEVQEVSDPLSQVDIDWQSIIDGTSVTPTHTVSSGSPDGDWPRYDTLPSSSYPVVYADDTDGFSVDGNDDGRGLLIVRGDLTLNGSFEWDGPVLVGGQITSDGNQTINGGMVTGLNQTLDPPEDVGEGNIDLGNGTKLFQYNTCEILNSTQGAATLVQLDHTWSEVF